MGRHSNVFLTNADMGVLECAYQVGAKTTSVRMVGGTYRLPPAAQGSLPLISMGMEEWKLITSATQEARLQKSLVGTSISWDRSRIGGGTYLLWWFEPYDGCGRKGICSVEDGGGFACRTYLQQKDEEALEWAHLAAEEFPAACTYSRRLRVESKQHDV